MVRMSVPLAGHRSAASSTSDEPTGRTPSVRPALRSLIRQALPAREATTRTPARWSLPRSPQQAQRGGDPHRSRRARWVALFVGVVVGLFGLFVFPAGAAQAHA